METVAETVVVEAVVETVVAVEEVARMVRAVMTVHGGRQEVGGV